MDDIMSLTRDKPLSTGVINFVIACLNYYSHKEVGDVDIPSYIFGDSCCLDKILPSKINFPVIQNFFKTSVSRIGEKDIKALSKSLKKWFYSSDKGFITRVLDKYQSKNFLIDNFVTIQELPNKDFALYIVDINEKSLNPQDSKVSSYDFNQSSTLFVDNTRVWLAKFFGLYFKDLNSNLKFNDDDFSGNDIKIELTNPLCQDDDPEVSILNATKVTIAKTFQDPNNSGIYCIAKCVSLLSGKSLQKEMGKTSEEHQRFCTKIRLYILSLIARIYDLLNSEEYDPLTQHLYMVHGDYNNQRDLEKWQLIHNLCKREIYKFDLKQNTNANTIFENKSKSQVLKDYKKFEPTKARKRKRNDENTQNKVTNCPTDLSESQKAKRMKLFQFILASQWPARYNPIFDISAKMVILTTDRDKFPSDVFDDSLKMKPTDVANEVSTIIGNRYALSDENEKETIKCYEKIEKLMKKVWVKTYCCFDMTKPDGESAEQYNIVAAFILEESLVFQDGKDCAVIHVLATEFGYEKAYQLKHLLYGVFSQDHLLDKTVIFAYQFGHWAMQHDENVEKTKGFVQLFTFADMFQDMGFEYRDIPDIKNDIARGSKTMIGTAQNIRDYCKRKYFKKKGLYWDNSNILTCLSNNAKVKYRYHNNKFEVYSHMFGWHTSTKRENTRMTFKKYAVENPDHEVYFFGSGTREPTHGINPNGDYDFSHPVLKKFQQSNYEIDSLCVWLNTALVIHSISETDGDKMITLFEEYSKKSHFKMMAIKRHQNETLALQMGIETLQQKLNRDIGYDLCKVSRTNKNGYLSQLINDTTSGQFIAQLKFDDGENFHLVGIDCDKQLIFDCYEKYALKLTKNNFDCCSGYGGGKIAKIPFCFELKQRQRKKSANIGIKDP